jgi:hypothetical protein
MQTLSILPKLAAVAASFTWLALVSVVPQAHAGKGIRSKPGTTGTYKAYPSPIIREHRGESTVGKPPSVPGCSRYPHRPCQQPIVRDHRSRGTRVAPKEDPRQQW